MGTFQEEGVEHYGNGRCSPCCLLLRLPGGTVASLPAFVIGGLAVVRFLPSRIGMYFLDGFLRILHPTPRTDSP